MMLPENTQRQLIKEIELFVEYSVEASERKTALALVERYRDNPVALGVLLEFYRILPETREEAVNRIAYLDALQGVTLLVLSTSNHAYLAVTSEGEAHILGEYGIDEVGRELLNFFGYDDNESFLASYKSIAELEEFASLHHERICPGCQVAVGEYHLLGCPVEVCPWCGGQLSRCNCRFEQLEEETLTSEEQLDRFQELLEEKGRLRFASDQKPAYPGTSAGLDRRREDKED